MADRCIESRVQKDGFRVRCYERPDGSRYRTVEVPLRAWQSRATKARVESSTRAAARIARRERCQALLRSGKTVAEVCALTGVASSSVYFWRSQMPERAPRRGRSVFDLG